MSRSVKTFTVAAGLVAAGFVAGTILVDLGRSTRASEPSSAGQGRTGSPAPTSVGGLPDLTPVAERAVRASVNISSTQAVATSALQQFLGADPAELQTSLGSGVIVSADGYILTNSHVVQSRQAEIKVTLSDQRTLDASVVGVDDLTDLAVVKVDITNATTLPWGDSSKLRLAEWVVAVGNPFAFSETVTAGIVSNVNRHSPQLDFYNDFIQTDAAINPGNSGGALVNTRGELVGINTMIFSQTGGYQGIGFAIPSNLARSIMEQLQANHEIVRGSIGSLALLTIEGQLAQKYPAGVMIRNMYRGEPAFQSGLRPGDIVTRFNGTAIKDEGQLRRLVVDAKVNTIARIEVMRDGRRVSFDVPVARMRPPQRRM
jgi:serine protease Do